MTIAETAASPELTAVSRGIGASGRFRGNQRVLLDDSRQDPIRPTRTRRHEDKLGRPDLDV